MSETVEQCVQSSPPPSTIDKLEWLQDVLTCLPDAGTRQRFLLRLTSFQQVNPRDPLFGTLDAMGLLTLAFRTLIGEMGQGVSEVRDLQSRIDDTVTCAERNLHSMVAAASDETRQLIEDVRAEMREAISAKSIVRSYGDETIKQFGLVVQGLMQQQLEMATAAITRKMDEWITGSVDRSVQQVGVALTAATRDFRVRLYGAWSGLLWAMMGGGAIAGLGMFFAGYWLGRH